MRIRGKIVMNGENAPEIAKRISRSIEPDNMKNITTEYGETSVTTCFEAEKIGTLIATVDDYIMNARIADDMIKAVGIDNKKDSEDDD
ncbi:MAG: KEOPS complex subunit Pcc1 [ANME-2 cluster archaeon]|nr:KEOPS complex subunit Pcc1 [ANME-2 cluster archaeon]